MVIYELKYRLGEDEFEERIRAFIHEQRIIKQANGGEIDDIRLVTGMRVKHYGDFNYQEAEQMGMSPEFDIIDIAIMISEISAFYPPKIDDSFTIVEIHGHKYMIKVAFNIMLELSRLVKSSTRQVNLTNKVDQDIRKNDGSISDEG